MKPGKDFIGLGCGAIIINDKHEVLLVKRSQNARTEPGYWSRPGGAVEFGETVEQAVKREVLEETGINVEVLKLLELTNNIDKEKRVHWTALGFLARYVSGNPQNMEPDKHDKVRWFPLSKLPEKLTNYTKNAIKVYLSSK